MDLRDWQVKANNKFFDNNKQGVFEVATAGGKSIAAMEILKRLNNVPSVVAVPTLKIMSQWINHFLNYGFNPEDIGVVGNGLSQVERRFVIGTFNSLRDKNFPDHKLMIVDECHNAVSEENRKFLLINFHIPYRLGLSATIEDEEKRELITRLIGPVVYTYSQDDGIADKVISDYHIVNKGVNLTNEEIVLYDECQTIISKYFKHFKFNYPLITKSLRHQNIDVRMEAIALMKAFNKRKSILQKASNKVVEGVQTIHHHYINGDKIIVFCENIELLTGLNKEGVRTCRGLIDELDRKNIPFVQYHGRKKDDISSFTDGNVNVLLSCKAMDEGFDFPRLNVGVVLAGNSTRKQFIQRSGRLLRICEGKTMPILYQYYCFETKDKDWLLSRMGGRTKNVTWQ